MNKIIVIASFFMSAVWFFPSMAADQKNTVGEFEEGMELKRNEKFAEAANVFLKIVEADPKNTDALQQLATLQGWLGRYEESIAAWRKAIEQSPNNYEFHIGLARVLSWEGDLRHAREEYSKSVQIKKEDFDALVGLGDVEFRLGNIRAAKDFYLKAQIQKPNDAGLIKKLEGAVPLLLWRIDTGYSYDGYKNSSFRVAEYNTYAQLGRQFSPRGIPSSLWLRHEWQYHFQSKDNTLYAGGSLRPIQPFAIQFEAGFTATPNFQPTQAFNTVLDLPVHKFFSPSIGLKYLAYRDGNVNLYTPGFRVEPLAWLAFTYRFSVSKNITGPDTEGWQIRADSQIGEKLSGYLGYAQGNESLPPLSTAFNESLFTGLVCQLNRQWAWRIDYSYENRPNFFIRSSIGSGLTFKF